MPRAYIESTLSSKPVHRVWCLATILGSKLLSRSRGTAISTSPKSPLSFFWLAPLRRLLPLPSAQMMSQLAFQCPLDQRFRQLLQQAAFTNQVLRFLVVLQQLVYQLLLQFHVAPLSN